MLSTLAFSTLYKIVDYFEEKDKDGNAKNTIGFLLNNTIRLEPHSWAWFFFEHMNMVIFAVIMLLPGQVRKGPGVVFVCIYVVDLINFMIHYDDPFVGIILKWNVVKIFIFLAAIIIENNERSEWKK